MKVESKGLNELLKNLDKLNKDVQKVGHSAVRKTAQGVAQQLSDNTPYDPNSKNPSHLKDKVQVQMKKTRDGSYKMAYVTYRGNNKGASDPNDVKWRAGFIEWGTKHIRPQGMVQKTVKQVEGSVQKDLERELSKALKRAVK